MRSGRESAKLQAHLEAAKAYSRLSYANRLKVGSVLVKDDRIISVGYNGTPSGRPNECEEPDYIGGTRTKAEVCHAELNVIAFAAKNGVSTNQCIMIITHSPCFECSKLIVQSGIKEVFYETEYRITDGIDFLRECGVRVSKINGSDKGKEEVGATTST